jgi:serine/threonine-protein kinase SRPK3
MSSTIESLRPVYVPADSYEGAESIDDYHPGGFHPTHLGDLLGQDGRYKVVHKLGHGGFGTVWLCRDLQRNSWRAVKILAASHSTGKSADLRIFKMLEHLTPEEKDVSVSHVVACEDHFWHQGPNGSHLCFVMPVLGPNLEDAAKDHQYQEEPLKRICYQLALAMKFLHEKGICHGDFRPNNICYVLKSLDDLDEESLMRVLGRPNLLCYVDDEEYDWRSDYAGESEGCEDYGEEDCIVENGHDNGEDGEDVELSPEPEEDDPQDQTNDSSPNNPHEPRYIVVPPLVNKYSGIVSDDVAVIDFGESFLVANAPSVTGIPNSYCAPEGFFESASTFGFGSDIWALGCSIFAIRRGGNAFPGFGLHGLVSYWEDLNGPLPEPYRSSFAQDADVPEDPSQWATLSVEERKDREAEYMKRAGVPGSLHMMLLLEKRFKVPLAKGESKPPPPPPGRGYRGSPIARPNEKILAYEMPEREAEQLMDLFKQTFAWMPDNRVGVNGILSHPWFDSVRGGEWHGYSVSSAPQSTSLTQVVAEIDDIPDCGILPYLPAALRRLVWLYGYGAAWGN